MKNQQFSSSTRFAFFCTAAIFFFAKNRFEKSALTSCSAASFSLRGCRVPSKALFTAKQLTLFGSFPNCSFKASRRKKKKKKNSDCKLPCERCGQAHVDHHNVPTAFAVPPETEVKPTPSSWIGQNERSNLIKFVKVWQMLAEGLPILSKY